MASSTSVVLAALFANGAIAVLKFGGFLLTGSPAMLSETTTRSRIRGTRSSC